MNEIVEILLIIFGIPFGIGLYTALVGGITPLRRIIRLASCIAATVFGFLPYGSGSVTNSVYVWDCYIWPFAGCAWIYLFTLVTKFLYDDPSDKWIEVSFYKNIFGDWHACAKKQDNWGTWVFGFLIGTGIVALLGTFLVKILNESFPAIDNTGAGFIGLVFLLIEIGLFLYRIFSYNGGES